MNVASSFWSSKEKSDGGCSFPSYLSVPRLKVCRRSEYGSTCTVLAGFDVFATAGLGFDVIAAARLGFACASRRLMTFAFLAACSGFDAEFTLAVTFLFGLARG